jgi:hypothetical protein
VKSKEVKDLEESIEDQKKVGEQLLVYKKVVESLEQKIGSV